MQCPLLDEVIDGDRVRLYREDCLRAMDFMRLQGERVSAVITDPPYGLDIAEWDREVPHQWLEKARSLADVVIFTVSVTGMWDYPCPDWVACWHQEGGTCRRPDGKFTHWNPIMIYAPAELLRMTWQVDIIKTLSQKHGYPPDFPHRKIAKPVFLMKTLIVRSTSPHQTVLDPFMGTGSTGVACIETHRRFIGIEQDPERFELSRERIAEAIRRRDSQPTLLSAE